MVNPLLSVLLAAWNSAPATSTEPLQAPPEEPGWSWSLNAYSLDPPDDGAYVSTILRADHGRLHLEGRYNYEDLDTGSLWAGRSYAWEGDLPGQIVPMVGIVAGDTDGAALGAELDLAWQRLALYVESEYLFDFESADDNFLFGWSELTFAASDWLSLGMVGQRTRVFDTDLEVDRGLVVGLESGAFTASIYWFNIDRDDSYVALWFGLSM